MPAVMPSKQCAEKVGGVRQADNQAGSWLCAGCGVGLEGVALLHAMPLHLPRYTPSDSTARPPMYRAALPRGQDRSAAAACCTNPCTAGCSGPRGCEQPLQACGKLSAAAPSLRSQERSWGTTRVATRLPPALPAEQVAAATAAAIAAPRSSPGRHTWVWLLTVAARAGMSELRSGSAGPCQVAMSPARGAAGRGGVAKPASSRVLQQVHAAGRGRVSAWGATEAGARTSRDRSVGPTPTRPNEAPGMRG